MHILLELFAYSREPWHSLSAVRSQKPESVLVGHTINSEVYLLGASPQILLCMQCLHAYTG